MNQATLLLSLMTFGLLGAALPSTGASVGKSVDASDNRYGGLVEAKSTIPSGDRGAPADTEGSGTRYMTRFGSTRLG
ncbi:MAG: hypothetical protein ACFCBU_05295 [Cyanophyceae cyanobacterium]